MSAAEYIARQAERAGIEEVAEEVGTVMKESARVKEAAEEFWCEFWQEISRRYA